MEGWDQGAVAGGCRPDLSGPEAGKKLLIWLGYLPVSR